VLARQILKQSVIGIQEVKDIIYKAWEEKDGDEQEAI
jgi:hypothetical protein